MSREPNTVYGAPLTEWEIEHLRCLIGSHKYKYVGDEDMHCTCVVCGEEEEKK